MRSRYQSRIDDVLRSMDIPSLDRYLSATRDFNALLELPKPVIAATAFFGTYQSIRAAKLTEGIMLMRLIAKTSELITERLQELYVHCVISKIIEVIPSTITITESSRSDDLRQTVERITEIMNQKSTTQRIQGLQQQLRELKYLTDSLDGVKQAMRVLSESPFNNELFEGYDLTLYEQRIINEPVTDSIKDLQSQFDVMMEALFHDLISRGE